MENSSASVGFSPGSPAVLNPAQERALLSKVNWRLIPLLFFCYVIAYIDRINVGFAKLQMREVLGVDEKVFNGVFGLGAGIFFIGYFIFEVPSNLILQRIGARVWIARIMILWGLISMAMMFLKSIPVPVTRFLSWQVSYWGINGTPEVLAFYVMRFLLGAAEAGFFPGVLLYFTYWYPAKERARTIAMFATGGVIAGVIGSPVSGAILGRLNGLNGLAGWQWLFILEAIPAVLVGVVVLFTLPNGPRQARWLSEAEKAWIQARLENDPSRSDSKQRHSLRDAFTSGRVWLLCLIYFLLNVGSYGYEMWLPTIVKGFSGQSDFVVGLINAIPYLGAGVVMLLVGRHSDRTGERRGHVAVAAFSSAIGFALSAYFKNPYLAMAALTLAFIGIKSTLGPFWAIGTALLSSTAAAGGIALINSVGNLGGYYGPRLVGLIKDRTGANNEVALLSLGAALLCMGLLALTIRSASPERATQTK